MSERAVVTIRAADRPSDIGTVRTLFLEYARSLQFSLCFQNFDVELAGLPGAYAAPTGRILLAEADGRALGVVALRRLDDDACEMKRLYVRPAARGRGLGKRLARAIMAEAARLGYAAIRLDTHESMLEAIGLYRGLGFVEIAAYGGQAVPGLRYYERSLTPRLTDCGPS
jgi:ribosomal protein S18 acetylase RimI-like enzyme